MQLDTSKIRHLRQHKAWTQQQLADICGLSLRTIQRVELHGSASLETGRSLAAAFDTEYTALLVNAKPDSRGSNDPSSFNNSPKLIFIGIGMFAFGVLVGALAMILLR